MDLERGRQLQRAPSYSPYKRALAFTAGAIAKGGQYAAPFIANALSTPKRRRISLPPTPMSRSRSRGRSMFRRSSRRRSSSSRGRASSGGVTTEQRDYATRYISRPQSRYRRKRWRSFTRKVQHVMLQMGGTQSFNLSFSGRNSQGVNTARWDGQMIGGTQANNNDELLQAFRRAYGTTVSASNVDDYRLFIKSLVLDLQISNIGDKNVVIEMHTLVLRKNYNVAERIDVMFDTCLAEIPPQTGFTQATSGQPTSSIFQNSIFCQYWKVLKKAQIVISPGETTTLQMRIPYNRMLQGKLIETNNIGIPGFTRAFFWQAKGSPEVNASAVQYSDFDIVWQSQTYVNYQVPPGSLQARTSIP